MEEKIRALLLGDPAVAGFVGRSVNFGAHPQGRAWPGIVLHTIDDSGDLLLAGPGGLDEARIQVDCYALDYAGAKRISRAVKSLLSGYSGDGLQGVFLEGSRDGREGGTNEASRPFSVSLDFMVTYSN